jgi:hypothetical protein
MRIPLVQRYEIAKTIYNYTSERELRVARNVQRGRLSADYLNVVAHLIASSSKQGKPEATPVSAL